MEIPLEVDTLYLVYSGVAIIALIVATLFLCSGGSKKDDKSDLKKASLQTGAPAKAPKTKKKDKKPATKKAVKKETFSNIIKSDMAAYEEEEEEEDDDDDDDKDDRNSVPPPLEPVSREIPKTAAPAPAKKSTAAATVPAPAAKAQPVTTPAVSKAAATHAPVEQPKAAAVPVPAVVEVESEESKKDKPKKGKETPEQKAARLERQKLAKASAATTSNSSASTIDAEVASVTSGSNTTAPASSVSNNIYEQFNASSSSSSAAQVDGWAKVEDKRKAKPVPVVAAPIAVSGTGAVDPAVPVVEVKKSTVSVDAKKVGVIIGPKGETLKALKTLLKVEINTPKEKSTDTSANATAVIQVAGAAENVATAIKAIQDLATKGYCPLLEGSEFMEGHINIHAMYVPELIGKGGNVRKALQDHTGVRIVVPANVSRDQNVPAKIILAGPPAKVSEAKKLIKELMMYFHTSVTHPGIVHNEMDIPSALYNLIIGGRGSEIKHIQNNFKVSVHIPHGADSVNQNVLIVGEAKNVQQASNYIQKIIDQAGVDKEAAIIAADSWADHENEVAAGSGEGEEWMQQYIKQPTSSSSSSGIDCNNGGTTEGTADDSEENPTLSMAYNKATGAGSSSSSSSSSATRAYTGSAGGSAAGQSWASAVLQSSEGW